jgi:hypothetical protein
LVALKRFAAAREVEIPKLNGKALEAFENRPELDYKKYHVLKDGADLQLGQDPALKLMPFQVSQSPF